MKMVTRIVELSQRELSGQFFFSFFLVSMELLVLAVRMQLIGECALSQEQ